MTSSTLKPTDMRILQALRSIEKRHRHTPDDEVFASLGTVGRRAGVSAKTVQRHLETLEARGIIQLRRRAGRPALFRITPLGYRLLRFERPGRGGKDRLSTPPRTDRPSTQDRVSSNKLRERVGDQKPLPAALLAKLERVYGRDQSREIVGCVERYSWVVQVASLEVMIDARKRVKSPARYVVGVAEKKCKLDEATLELSYDPPDYDPYVDGLPNELHNRRAWNLRQQFRDAVNLDEARKLEREELEVDEWLQRDRIATAEQLSREAQIKLWGAAPREKLAASGYTSSEETTELAKAIVEDLKRRGAHRAD